MSSHEPNVVCVYIFSITGIALALVGLSTMGTSTFSLVPPALRELVGEEYVTNGMGLQMLFQACGFIGASFIAGKLDRSSSIQTPNHVK